MTSMTDGAEWRKNGVYHRDDDLPARVFDNGRMEWWIDGEIHRDDPGPAGEDRPAVITETGDKLYYKRGKYHRDNDLPARVFDNGRLEWYVDGKMHRDDPGPGGEDRPAVITETGDKLYYKDGKLHRDGDKPAKEFANGLRAWFINDKCHRDPGADGEDRPAYITEKGDLWYYKHGKPHRDGDKPAGIVAMNTDLWYYKHGKCHRDGDKPARITVDSQSWYKNGLLHRNTLDKNGDPLPSVVNSEWSSWFVEGELKNPKYPWVSMLADGTKGYYREHPSHILFDNGLKFMLDSDLIVISQVKGFMDERTDIELLKCCVCMENKKNTLFNCGHLSSCRACSERMERCPMCRADVSTRTNVYL